MTNTEDARARLSEENRALIKRAGYILSEAPFAGWERAWNALLDAAREEGRRPAQPPPGVERERIARIISEAVSRTRNLRCYRADERQSQAATIIKDAMDAVIAALPREGVSDDLGLDTPLPCDVSVNHITYRKGVKLRTLVEAATRWHTKLAALQPPHPDPAGGGEFVWVPREPSQEMRKAALEKWGELLSKRIPVFVAMQDVLRAAIAAAPGDQKCSGPDGPPGLGSTQLRRQSDTSSAPEAEWSSPDLEIHARLAQQGFDNPIAQVAVRAGFLMCREIMARFVEQGGDVSTAASIRANWIPAFGDDPGPPRKYDFAEVAEAEDVENGPWRSKNPGACVDGAVYALEAMHALGIAAPAERDPSAVAPELGSASAEPKASGPLPTDQDTGGER